MFVNRNKDPILSRSWIWMSSECRYWIKDIIIIYIYFKLQKSRLNDNAKLIKYYNKFYFYCNILQDKITNKFNRLICYGRLIIRRQEGRKVLNYYYYYYLEMFTLITLFNVFKIILHFSKSCRYVVFL